MRATLISTVRYSEMGTQSQITATGYQAKYQDNGNVMILAKPLQGCANMGYSHRIAICLWHDLDAELNKGWKVIAF